MPDTFATKSGHATVTADLLAIERTGLRGAAAQRLQGDSKRRTSLIYAVVCGYLAFAGLASFRIGHHVSAALLWGFGGWMASWLLLNRNFSMLPQIPRSAVTRVQFVRGWRGLTRDRVVVHFVKDGAALRRFVLMPGVLQKGAGELDRARAVFEAHGWPVDPCSTSPRSGPARRSPDRPTA